MKQLSSLLTVALAVFSSACGSSGLVPTPLGRVGPDHTPPPARGSVTVTEEAAYRLEPDPLYSYTYKVTSQREVPLRLQYHCGQRSFAPARFASHPQGAEVTWRQTDRSPAILVVELPQHAWGTVPFQLSMVSARPIPEEDHEAPVEGADRSLPARPTWRSHGLYKRFHLEGVARDPDWASVSLPPLHQLRIRLDSTSTSRLQLRVYEQGALTWQDETEAVLYYQRGALPLATSSELEVEVSPVEPGLYRLSAVATLVEPRQLLELLHEHDTPSLLPGEGVLEWARACARLDLSVELRGDYAEPLQHAARLLQQAGDPHAIGLLTALKEAGVDGGRADAYVRAAASGPLRERMLRIERRAELGEDADELRVELQRLQTAPNSAAANDLLQQINRRLGAM